MIAGYNATPEGETLVGAFIAGYRRRRPDHGFFTLLYALGDFGAGGRPLPSGSRGGVVGKVARQFLEAIERGAAMPIDLSDGWDFRPYLDQPLDEVRALLGVPVRDEGGHRWDYA